jgi:hypothetical protein
VVPIGGRAAGQVLIGVVAVVVEPTAHGREHGAPPATQRRQILPQDRPTGG